MDRMYNPSRETVARLREQFPKGCLVRLNSMEDPYRPEMVTGLLGTVVAVDDMGTIHVKWENGCQLGVVYGVDSCSVYHAEE